MFVLALPTQAFALLGTTTAVISSVNPSSVGASVTFTATVTGFVVTPTGTVTFKDGATTIGSGTLNGSGQATFATSALAVGSHSITAVYGGDLVYNPSTSPVLTQNVNAYSTSTAVVSSVNPSALTQSVTFTATVTSGGGTPTGTVTFKDGATTLGTGTLNGGGQATFATSLLLPGDHSITAEYGGDSNFSASVSPVLTQTVNLGLSSTAVVSSSNPSSVGQSVTFTATVSGLIVPPTGTVTFKDGAGTIGTGTLNGSGQATFATSALSLGGHSITAVYEGDLLYNTSTSGVLNQNVNPNTTSTSVMSSANPAANGASVTFTATVTSPGGIPVGNVTFKDGAGTIGSGALDGSGQATFSTSALSLGGHSITAVYDGDVNFTTSTSPVLTQTITANASATALISSLNPSSYGASVTFTATVTSGGGTPTGTVTFRDGATILGSSAVDGGGVAAYSTNALTAGSHSITATYNGDASFGTSTSSPLTQTVNSNSTTASISASVFPSAFGVPLTFSVTVSGAGGTPTGTVTFMDGAVSLGTETLDGSGNAALSIGTLTAGSHSITALYSGDSNFNATSSIVWSQSVVQNGTQVALTSSANPSIRDQAVTFTATVTGAGGTPTGNVTFRDGSTALATVALTGGTAATTLSTLTVGTHSITAAYDGDVNFTASVSAAINQTVGVPPDSVKLRKMQALATRRSAVISGQAVSGAIDSAIDAAWADSRAPLTPSELGLRLSFAPEYDDGPRFPIGFPSPREERKPPWTVWTDLRATELFANGAQGGMSGRQFNTTAGITYRISHDFIAGVFGGYESFNFSSGQLDAQMSGQGLSAGGFFSWRFLEGLRFDIGASYSAITYKGKAGTASATIPASRTLAKAGMTGLYKITSRLEFEPSLRAFAAWENDDAFVDSLGTPQASRSFMSGSIATGARLAYRWDWSDTITLTPHIGVYADYIFGKEDNDTLAQTTSIAGTALRLQLGLAATSVNGARISFNAEAAGLDGKNFNSLSLRTRAAVPF